MEKVSDPERKSSPPALCCPDCGLSVDVSSPCWLRISPVPSRTNAWHIHCRDLYLRGLRVVAARAAEEREQFQAALAMLGRISATVQSAGDTISDGEALSLIRDLVGGGS